MPETICDRPLSLVNVYGVRHLSPMGAWQLRRYLDRVQPTAVLVEGLSDATNLFSDIVRPDTQPPIAILAYTTQTPVRTLVYPVARYSPEYQALLWAAQNNAHAQFIDLPSDVFLAFQRVNRFVTPESQQPPKESSPDQAADELSQPDPSEAASSNRRSLYEQIALQYGETDYESYWERNFEHNTLEQTYQAAAIEFGEGLRSLSQDHPLDFAENLVRESFMRRQICQVIDAGHDPEKIVVVVGAYHAKSITNDPSIMTDEELALLTRLPSKLTLMPYSYFKLSSQSGYGAGNHAPAYFELIWQALQQGQLDHVPARYFSLIARSMRDEGTHRSIAEVIEAVRLARTLSALKEGMAPTLADLQDAAVALLGHGERSSISTHMARAEVGTAIGSLPRGVSQTSIQEDFDRELKRLNLEKYRSTVKQDLSLDLRENRQAKSASSAYLDLNRSSFLHKLHLLGVQFGVPVSSRQQSASWAEHWQLQWTPEVEIAIVESVLLGETIDLAAGFQFKTRLDAATTIDAACEAIDVACRCGMFDSLELARIRLQQLAAESSEFNAVALGAQRLGNVIRYGSVRRYDPAPLMPLLEQLFVQGSLAMFDAATCDNAAAQAMSESMEALNRVAQEFDQQVDESLWVAQLQRLSDADNRNPILSGYACAILLERTLISNEQLAREVSRRLSPGIPADLGAGWFEGISKRNRYALLARQTLWAELASYVALLDDDQFKRALVFLRRSFGNFSPAEKRSIAENLAEVWKIDQDNVSEILSQELTTAESEALDSLNDFDFGDL